jgi:hypothetical protein
MARLPLAKLRKIGRTGSQSPAHRSFNSFISWFSACWKWDTPQRPSRFGPQQTELGGNVASCEQPDTVAPADSQTPHGLRNKRNKRRQFTAPDPVSAVAASEVPDPPFGGFRRTQPHFPTKYSGVVAVQLASKHRLVGQLQKVSREILRQEGGRSRVGRSRRIGGKCVGFCVAFRRKLRFSRVTCTVF